MVASARGSRSFQSTRTDGESCAQRCSLRHGVVSSFPFVLTAIQASIPLYHQNLCKAQAREGNKPDQRINPSSWTGFDKPFTRPAREGSKSINPCKKTVSHINPWWIQCRPKKELYAAQSLYVLSMWPFKYPQFLFVFVDIRMHI